MVERDKLNFTADRFPIACQWEITCRCNLHCVMCYTDCFNRPDRILQELNTADVLRIMDELAEAGTLELCLTGGEPLIRQDFFQIYEQAVHHGFLVTVFTNGTLITETVADRFSALRPNRIEISLHGLTTGTFEGVTQVAGSHARCFEGIKLLIDRQIPLTLKSTVMTINQHEILAIKRYAESLNVVGYALGVEIRPQLNGGTGPYQYTLSTADLEVLNRPDKELWKEYCQQRNNTPTPCQSGRYRFHIDAYGRLQLCSGNRTQCYDLRSGSFREGFFEQLPSFTCEYKLPGSLTLIHPAVRHA